MAPALESQSEESQQELSLEFIEHTLRKLQHDTLKIQRNNEETIRQGRLGVSYMGWKGSPIDVPPLKPLGTSKFGSSLLPEVEKLLRESEDMKRKAQETLKLCEASRKENKQYLENLRQESIKLSTKPGATPDTVTLLNAPLQTPTTFAASTTTPVMQGLNKMIQKLGFTSSTQKNKDTLVFEKPNLRPKLQNDKFKKNKPTIEMIPLYIEETSAKDQNDSSTEAQRRIMVNKADSIQPIAKPRLIRPCVPPPPLPLLPLSPIVKNATLFELQNLYRNEKSEDELSLLPPIPKPRHNTAGPRSSDEFESESSSEFEWVNAPLVVQTVALPESDDSFDLTKNHFVAEKNSDKREWEFQKNPRKLTPQRPCKKHKNKSKSEAVEGNSIKCSRIRASSPPPGSISCRIISTISSTLSNVSEEELPLHCQVEDNNQNLNLAHTGSTLSNWCRIPPDENRTSALCSGVTITGINVPIVPWTSKFMATPEPKENLSNIFQLERVQGVCSEKSSTLAAFIESDAEQNINNNFAFLDEEITEEMEESFRNDGRDLIENTCSYQILVELIEFSEQTSILPPPVVVVNECIDANEEAEVFPDADDAKELEELSIRHKEDDKTELICSSSDLQSPPVPPVPPPPPPFTVNQNKTPYSSLPVVPLNESNFQDSIFKNLVPMDAKSIGVDVDYLKKIFVKDLAESETRRQSVCQNAPITNKNSVLSFLSSKRKNAIEIGSRKMKQSKQSYADIIESIKCINIEGIQDEDIQLLIQIFPENNEEKLLFENLDEQQCETLPEEYRNTKALIKIPRFQDKLNAMTFLMTFKDLMKCVENNRLVLSEAMNSVKSSEKFRTVLGIVLTVVNSVMTENDAPVKGFQIQSLSRLARKGSYSHMSLLNYIAKCIADTKSEALHFYNEFKRIEEASKVSIPEVNKIIKDTELELRKALKEIKQTIEESTEDEKLNRSLNSVNDLLQQHAKISEGWQSTLSMLQHDVKFFGTSTEETELTRFFSAISEFVLDYKVSIQENVRNFSLQQNDDKFSIGEVKMRKCPYSSKSDSPNFEPVQGCSMGAVKLRNRKSLGKLQLQSLIDLSESSGQPLELIDSLANNILGVNMNAEQERRNRRRSRGPNELNNRDRE